MPARRYWDESGMVRRPANVNARMRAAQNGRRSYWPERGARYRFADIRFTRVFRDITTGGAR